jgi:methanogenic corrinoid protein MtbC1
MQTAQAINALRYQEQHGHVISVEDESRTSQLQNIDLAYFDLIQDRLFTVLVTMDTQKADHVLGEALTFSIPEDLIFRVISPVLNRIGEAWENDQINVATEHLATNYLRQRLLTWILSGPPPRPVPPLILACAPNELHEGSLLIMGAMLRRRRWPIIYLGQAVPLPDLARITKEINPSMVILVAMTQETASYLVEWPEWLPEVASSGIPPVGYGGRIFTIEPEWRDRMTGIFLGTDYQQGIENIELLLG